LGLKGFVVVVVVGVSSKMSFVFSKCFSFMHSLEHIELNSRKIATFHTGKRKEL